MGVVFLLLNKPEKARPFIQKTLKVSSLSKKVSLFEFKIAYFVPHLLSSNGKHNVHLTSYLIGIVN